MKDEGITNEIDDGRNGLVRAERWWRDGMGLTVEIKAWWTSALSHCCHIIL